MSTDDRDLRALLHETAQQITPRGTFEQIQVRTVRTPVRRWALPTLAAAAVLALVVGGIGWMVRGDDKPASPSGSPSGDATGGAVTERAVPVYYAGEAARGLRLYREFEHRQVCSDPLCLVKASVTQTLSGRPDDPDYRSLWPAGVGLHGLDASADLITVDLSGDVHDRPSDMSAPQAELALQQLIYSTQAGYGQGRVPVQLLLDGNHTDTILGVPASEPLAAASAADVLAPVQISTPGNGATVQAGDVKVDGVAEAFEATVVWELMVGGDTVVKNGNAMAAECCVLSPYSFTIRNVQPGTYTLVVHDVDESGEGHPVNQDTKEIIVE